MQLNGLFLAFCALVNFGSWATPPTDDSHNGNSAYNYLVQADSLKGKENKRASELLDSAYTILKQNRWPDLDAEYYYLKSYLAMSDGEYGVSLEHSYKAFEFFSTSDNIKRIADCYYILWD
jgi:hypothetical protein